MAGEDVMVIWNTWNPTQWFFSWCSPWCENRHKAIGSNNGSLWPLYILAAAQYNLPTSYDPTMWDISSSSKCMWCCLMCLWDMFCVCWPSLTVLIVGRSSNSLIIPPFMPFGVCFRHTSFLQIRSLTSLVCIAVFPLSSLLTTFFTLVQPDLILYGSCSFTYTGNRRLPLCEQVVTAQPPKTYHQQVNMGNKITQHSSSLATVSNNIVADLRPHFLCQWVRWCHTFSSSWLTCNLSLSRLRSEMRVVSIQWNGSEPLPRGVGKQPHVNWMMAELNHSFWVLHLLLSLSLWWLSKKWSHFHFNFSRFDLYLIL